jgi:hypothetical protein
LRRGVTIASLRHQGGVRVERWSHASLETREAIQIDGEVVEGGVLDVVVEPKGLRVMVPPTLARVLSHRRARTG